jgi:hypothetical protein
MKSSLVDILIRPDAFFRNVITQKASLKIPALIILAGGIVGALYGYLIGKVTGQMMSSIMPGMEMIIAISTIAGGLAGTFIFWGIWAAVIFAFSVVFKGQGDFRSTFKVIGYGYLPQVFGTIITLIFALDYIPRVSVPRISATAAQDPQVITDAVKTLMHNPAMMELTQITMLITIVFLLWSAHIWIFGMQHARRLSPRDAALCVGIPVVAYILYMIYNLGVM